MKRIFLAILAVALVTSLNTASVCRGEERNTSTPDKALIGHWRFSDTQKEIYFSTDRKVVQVNGEDGTSLTGEYVYESTDNHPDEMKTALKEMGIVGVVVLFYSGSDVTMLFKFSPDYQVMDGILLLGETEMIDYKLDYIDGKQKP